jgi:hypothetical protein
MSEWGQVGPAFGTDPGCVENDNVKKSSSHEPVLALGACAATVR